MKKQTFYLDLLWLGLGITFFYLFFGHSHALLNPDESRYSEIAREMIATGDFITPRLNGIIFFDKPILYYWQQALSMKIFGINEWSLRFFPALYGVFGCLLMYVGGYSLFNRRTGIIAALSLACSPFYFLAAHYANMDLEVAVLITASLIFFIVSQQDKFAASRRGLLWASYVFAALAILTKGLIGIVFPIMIIGWWMLIARQWQTIRQMRIISGLLIIACIVTPWFYLVQKQNPTFLHYFFTIQHFERFTTADFNSQSPFWFYAPVILLGIFPWVLFLFPATRSLWRERKSNPAHWFLLIWPTLIFIFFSVPRSKLIGYILPVLPPLILISSYYIDKTLAKFNPWLIRSIILFNGLLAVACLVVPHIPNLDSSELITAPCTLLGISLLFSTMMVAIVAKRCTSETIFHSLTAASFASLALLALLLPTFDIPSNKPLVDSMLEEYKPGDEIVNYFHYFYDVPIYSNHTVTLVSNWDDPAMLRKDNWRRIFLYGLEASNQPNPDYIKPQILWKKWQEPTRLFVFTRKSHIKFIKHQVKHYTIIAEADEYVVLSNR